MAKKLKSLKGAKLKNIILSSNPCPICIDAARQLPMVKTKWRNSRWGLTDSKKRYCNLKANSCHCILVPPQMMDLLPDVGERIPLRGDRRSDIRGIIEIGPNELELQLLMDEYNFTVGTLPSEIYDMPLEEVAEYLRGLLGGTPVLPPIVPSVVPPAMATVKKAQKYLWSETEKDGLEMGVIFSRDGKYMLNKKGTKHYIRWSAEEANKAKGGTMWHTHPHDVAHSFQDVEFAAARNMKEMGVIAEKHIYSIKPKTTWAEVDIYSLKYAYTRQKDIMRTKYLPYYNRLIAGGIPSQKAAYAANHYCFLDLWDNLAPRFNLTFSAKRKGF